MANGNWTSGARVDDAYTYAQLSALASAGGLTPHSWYVASGVRYWAPDASTLTVDQHSTPRRSLLTVVCGNSIAAANKLASGAWYGAAAIPHANAFGGGYMRFTKMLAATTRSDAVGIYGYSGATLSTILGDIQAQWLDQIAQAGVTPELVVGLGLVENDITAGRTTAQITADLDAWIRWMQLRWPGVIVQLCTPLPSHYYNTAGLVGVYQEVRDYMMSLDNGVNIFTTDMSGYESTSSPGLPDNFSLTASQSSSTLTVTAASGTLELGMYVMTAPGVNAGYISAFGTGTGGTGTYTLSTSATVSSTTWYASPYTDDGPHPRTKGAMRLGRAMAATARRISEKWTQPGTSYATNPVLTGSSAASGTGVSGTWPTGCGIGGTANGTHVSVASAPGWTITYANAAQGTGVDLSTINMPALAFTGLRELSSYVVVKVVSGGSRIRSIRAEPRIQEAGSGNGTFRNWLAATSTDANGEYLDGDVLTFVSPPEAGGGNMTQMWQYLRTLLNWSAGTDSATIQVLEHGYIPLTIDGQGQLYVPAAAGTVTVNANLGGPVRVTMPAGNITMAAPLYPKLDQRLDFVVLQDGTGGRTITWNAAFKKAADGAGGANGVGATSFVYNGTNWVQLGGALAFA